MNEWISVEDRLPKSGKKVLAFNPIKLESVERFVDEFGWVAKVNTPTHWQPLPEPPEKP